MPERGVVRTSRGKVLTMDDSCLTSYNSKQSKRWKQAAVLHHCLSSATIVLFLASVTISTYLYVNQTRLTNKIHELEELQKKLFASTSPGSWVGHHDVATRYTLERVRRQVDSTDTDGLRRKMENSRKKKKKKKIMGAHFVAEFDKDRMLRQISDGIAPSIGNLTREGLVVKEQIYNIWTPMDWNNKKLFRYHPTSGKVKVRSSGLYLIYGQIMFHSAHTRRSYGIHINDEIVPYVEALSFRSTPYNQRVKRHLNTYVRNVDDPLNRMLGLNTTEYSTHGHIRKKRTIQAVYSQCNTIALAHLNKNDEVFLKSLERFSIIIPRKYLTFWGLVKL